VAEDDAPEVHLAGCLLEGIQALQDARPHDAIGPLDEVARDPDLAATTDLADIRARACSLLADAHLQLGNLDEASWAARAALALLRDLDDAAGRSRVQAIWTGILDLRKQRKANELGQASAAKLRQWSLQALEDRFGHEPLRFADVLIKKANAEIEGGATTMAVGPAERALAIAMAQGAVREEVFARLSLARAVPALAVLHLEAAWRRAERANEFNLVGAVAVAAHAMGLQLAVQDGPDMTRKPPDA
jgi:hypothetical protein